MKINKIYAGILTALLSTTAVHASTTNSGFFKSGAYMGLAIGYSYMNIGINDQSNVPGFPATTGNVNGVGLSHNIVGDILAGYRQFFKNGTFLGAELDLGRDNNKVSKLLVIGTKLSGETSLKSNYKFLPSIVIGQQLNDRWLAYAKLGASIRGFKLDHSATSTGAPSVSQSFSKNKVGFMAALGTEYAFDKNVSGTFDVSYERFQKIDVDYNRYNSSIPITQASTTGSFKPTYVTVKVGVLYRF